MRGLLAAAALLAFLPTAHAQDKAKSDFTIGGEFRVRDTWEMNESGNKNTKPASHNGVDQRFKLGVNFKANEKISAHATLLQGAAWGQASGESVGSRGAANSAATNAIDSNERNFMSVNEAYANWMMSEDFHARIGRQNFAFGDGSVMSMNDWQRQPYAFDGVVLGYEAEFGKFTAFGFKYRDYSIDTAISNTNTTTSDPQHDAYGLVFDLKTMPEWLKMVEAHLIQDKGDTIWGNTMSNGPGSLGNQDTLRGGVGLGFGFMGFDLTGDYEMVTGKASQAPTAGTGAVTDADKKDIKQSMMQAQVGYSMPALMGSRWYVGYHQDSGTSSGDSAKNFKTYDGYFHDLGKGSGMMELVGWGNLTYMNLGWTVKPQDSTDVGIQWFQFTKTNSEDAVTGGMYGSALFSGSPSTKLNDKNIGQEIDLWAEHHYDANFAMLARLGYFMPGSALKDSTINKGDAVTQIQIQGKLTF